MDPREPGLLVHPTVRDDPSIPSLVLAETEVHLETFGDPDDPVIIVLHGGPGNDYRYMLRLLEPFGGPSLSDDYFWVFWDQRGAGLSERHEPEQLSLAAYLRDLEEVVDTFAAGREVVLVGHSWGGQYAAMYMDAHPERIAGAVLAEPGRLRWDITEFAEDFDFDYLSEYLSDYLWTRQFISMSDHERADYVTSLLMVEQTNGREEEPSPNWRVGAAVLLEVYLNELEQVPFDFTTRLAEVDAPVLLLAGEKSVDLGPAFQAKQVELFADARVVEIADAGHTDVVYGRAQSSVPVLRDYLASLGEGGW